MYEQNLENQAPEISNGLKSLTTLTFIGSALTILVSFCYPFLGKLVDFMEQQPGVDAAQIDGLRAMANNWWLYFISTILFSVLCIIGAKFMRNGLKKGLPIYMVGELLPIVFGAIMQASQSFKGSNLLVNLIIPAIFCGLYFSKRNELR